jgi:DNA repair exonuclease SbcCD nuclease subunit
MGMEAKSAGEKARDVRNARYESAKAIVKVAKDQDVDFVLLAGDTFEHESVGPGVITRTVEILNQFAPLPVYVLPGNHDPLRPGGIWQQPAWRAVGKHVTLCADHTEVILPANGVLYPCPLKQKLSRVDPTEWIPSRQAKDERIRIGLAHGGLTVLPNAPNFPIAQDRPSLSGLDYLALGDWHGHRQDGRAVYSGTHEQTAIDELDPGNVLVVQLAKSGADPQISKVRVGALTWKKLYKDIQSTDDVAALRKEVNALGPPERVLLRAEIHVHSADPDVARELETLQQILSQILFRLDWQEHSAIEAGESLIDLPAGNLQRMDAILEEVLQGRIPESPGRFAAAYSAASVSEARKRLHALIREVRG